MSARRRFVVEWDVPLLEMALLEEGLTSTIATLSPESVRLLREHGIGVQPYGASLSERSLAACRLLACSRAPLDVEAIAQVGLGPCCASPVPPPAHLVLALARDAIQQILAGAGLYRVGEFFLRENQLCAEALCAEVGQAQGSSVSFGVDSRLKLMTALRCTLQLVACGGDVDAGAAPKRAAGLHHGKATFKSAAAAQTKVVLAPTLGRVRAAFSECVVRFRQQRADRPLLLRTLLPALHLELDAHGVCDLMAAADDYEALSQRAVAMLLPSEERVMILCVATTHKALDQFANARELADGVPAERASRARPRRDGSTLLALADIPLWALVTAMAPAVKVDDDDDYMAPMTTSPPQPASAEPTHPLDVAFVVNGIQLFDAVGLVPSATRELSQDEGGDESLRTSWIAGTARSARDCVRAALEETAPISTPLAVPPPPLSFSLAQLGGPSCRARVSEEADPAAVEDDPLAAGIEEVTFVEREDGAEEGDQPYDLWQAEPDEIAVAALSRAAAAIATDGGEGEPPERDARRTFTTAAVQFGRTTAPPAVAQMLPPPAKPSGVTPFRPPMTASYDRGSLLLAAARAQPQPRAVAVAPSAPKAPPLTAATVVKKRAAVDARKPTKPIDHAAKRSAPQGKAEATPPRARAPHEIAGPDGVLTAVGLRAIDAAFDQCDLDRDGVLCRSDLDAFQKATGGEPLADEDLAYLCSQFESVAVPAPPQQPALAVKAAAVTPAPCDLGMGLTRNGFRKYFADAFADNADGAFSDLKSFGVVD
jgi:hypothetical protein